MSPNLEDLGIKPEWLQLSALAGAGNKLAHLPQLEGFDYRLDNLSASV